MRAAVTVLLSVTAGLAAVAAVYPHYAAGAAIGLLAGFLCLWLWPRTGPRPLAGARLSASPVRRRIASIYLGGAVAAASIGTAAGGAALWLWWIAVALALVAAIYAITGAAGFQKRGGSQSLAVSVLAAPYLVAARLLPVWRSRKCPAPSAIRDGVWLGRLPFAREMARSASAEPGGAPEFAALLDLTGELSIAQGAWRYVSMPWLDLVAPAPEALDAAAREIERLRREGGPVLVSCAMGRGRSAIAVAAWLLLTGRAEDAADAIAQVRACRPQVVLRPAHREVLTECERLWRTTEPSPPSPGG